MSTLRNRIAFAGLLATCAAIWVAPCFVARSQAGDEPPKIKVELSKVPDLRCGPGGTAEIKGKITGLASSKDYRIVIYAKCDDVYYVQPTIKSPLTEIDDDGTFTADVHGGQEYVALLVKDDYKPAAQMEELPKDDPKVAAKSKPKRAEKK